MSLHRDYWGKNRAFVEAQCAEGTLRKFGHSGEKIGLLEKMSVQKGHFGVKIVLLR